MRKEVEIMAKNLINTFAVTLVIENSDYEELDRVHVDKQSFAWWS